MSARERLRRYLEQRREMGESELVLDGMSVEDVMRLVGIRAAAAPPAFQEKEPQPDEEHGESYTPSPESPLRQAPTEPSLQQSPPVPAPRQSPSAGADWRSTLRNAETGHRAESVRADASPEWLQNLGIPIGLSVRASAIRPEPNAGETLEEIAREVSSCTRCPLYSTALNPVPGEGNPDAEFVCVGEAPGQNEDQQGRPFVGAAGDLLGKILGAIQLKRDDVFICNVIKHRPPGNRDPLPDEVLACQPYLERQLDIISPRVILALGRFAAQTLLNTTLPISKLRSQVHQYRGVPLIVTYHPAALLRNASWKRPTWEDVQLARRVLDASRLEDSQR